MKIKIIVVSLFTTINCFAQQNDKKVVKTVYKNGRTRALTEMVNDKKNGKEVLYLENGSIYMVQHFKDDLLVDSFFQYNSDTVLLKGYCTPKVHVKIYDTNNNLFAENDYLEKNVTDGIVRLYYKNNKIAKIAEYKSGHKDGIDIAYFLNGNIKRIVHYKDGIVVPPIVAFDSVSGKVVEYVPNEN